jgi:predicted transcriptional regulator
MYDAYGNFEPELNWDESFYQYVEQIEQGVEPVAIPFQVELGFDGQPPRVLGTRRGTGETPPPPRCCVINVTYQLTRTRLREIVLDQIADAKQQAKSPLAALALLARVDREGFLEQAALHVIEQFADSGRMRDGDEMLHEFIVDLHERDPALVVDLTRRALAKRPVTGEQFRELLFCALNEPPLRDELGLLAAAALVDELESLPT